MIVLALVDPDRPFGDVVKKIEIEIIGPALLQRQTEKRGVVHRARQGMAGEFVRDEIGLPRIPGKRLRHGELRFAAEIRIGRVEIVDPAADREIEHVVHLLLVDLAGCGVGREAHASEAEPGKLQPLKIAVEHSVPPSSAAPGRRGGTLFFYDTTKKRALSIGRDVKGA